MLAGCHSEIKVKPHAETGKQPYLMVCGDLKYSGNKHYLPSTVAGCGNETAPAYLIEFFHEQDYTGTKAEYEMALSMLPSYLFGSPTGTDKVLVYSRLRISQQGKELATYRGACVKETYRSLYSGGVDNSEGRVKCLEALKVNLEQQMLRDEAFWKNPSAR